MNERFQVVLYRFAFRCLIPYHLRPRLPFWTLKRRSSWLVSVGEVCRFLWPPHRWWCRWKKWFGRSFQAAPVGSPHPPLPPRSPRMGCHPRLQKKWTSVTTYFKVILILMGFIQRSFTEVVVKRSFTCQWFACVFSPKMMYSFSLKVFSDVKCKQRFKTTFG